jgi:hypothetical protein
MKGTDKEWDIVYGIPDDGELLVFDIYNLSGIDVIGGVKEKRDTKIISAYCFYEVNPTKKEKPGLIDFDNGIIRGGLSYLALDDEHTHEDEEEKYL